MTPYSALFTPLAIKHLEIRNRLLSTSHSPGYAVGGRITERYLRYQEEKGARRRGAHPVREAPPRSPSRTPSTTGRSTERATRSSPSTGAMAERIHEHGAACTVQLTPRRAPGALGQRQLAARLLRVLPARAGPPLLSRGDGAPRHRARAQLAYAQAGAPGAGRPPRRGSRSPPQAGTLSRAVLVPRHQPPRGRLRRLAREPDALRARARRSGAPRGGLRLPRGDPHVGRRDARGRPEPRGLHRDRPHPRGARGHRLHQRGRRAGYRLQGERNDLADDVAAVGTLPALGERDPGGGGRAGVPRNAGSRTPRPRRTPWPRGTST